MRRFSVSVLFFFSYFQFSVALHFPVCLCMCVCVYSVFDFFKKEKENILKKENIPVVCFICKFLLIKGRTMG